MVEALLTGCGNLERDVGVGLQQRYPLRQRLPPQGLAEEVLPLLRVLRGPELRRMREERVGMGALETEDAGECPRLMGQLRVADDEAAVLGRHRQAVPGGGQCPAAGVEDDLRLVPGVLRVLPVHCPEVVHRVEALHQGGLDALPAAGPLADDKGRQDAADGHVRGTRARHRRGGEDRSWPEAELPPGERSGLRRHDALVALQPRVPAGGAEAVDRAVDQRRAGRVQGLVAQLPAVGDAGLEALDQHVGVGREGGDLSPARGGAQVCDEAFLAPVPDQETGW